MKSEAISLGARLKALKKPGDSFTVTTKAQRRNVLNTAQILTAAGVLTLTITTRANRDGTFKVVAI